MKSRPGDLLQLVHLGIQYNISRALGAAISGFVRKAMESSPSVKTLNLPPIPGNFAVFKDLFWNVPTSVYVEAIQDVRFLYLMGGISGHRIGDEGDGDEVLREAFL